MKQVEPGSEYDNHERCKCGKPEQGYAVKDGNRWRPACWACVKSIPQAPVKRLLTSRMPEDTNK